MPQNLQKQTLSPEERILFEIATCFFPALKMVCPQCKANLPFPTRDIRRNKGLLLSAITGETGSCICELCKSCFYFKVNASVSASNSHDFKETNKLD